MSNLLNAGLSASDTAKVSAHAKYINDISRTSTLEDISIALDSYNHIAQIFINKFRSHDRQYIEPVLTKEYGWNFADCHWTGNRLPMKLLVAIPDGNGWYATLNMVVRGDWEWEFSANGTLIRSARLYGDRDILNYSTDPLSYLKFRTLPNEKAQYNIKEDPSVNDEYSGIAPIFLGIELEVERKKDTPSKIAHMITDDLGSDYVILKNDSSLNNGFEIVTAPATIRFHKKAWDKFFENSGKLISSWASGRCGMHVHVSRAAFTPLHLGKFISFINNNENRDFITTIAGRQSTYSKFYEDNRFHVKSKLVSLLSSLDKQIKQTKDAELIKKLQTDFNKVRAQLDNHSDGIKHCDYLLKDIAHGSNGERHTSVNLSKRGTVELRIFRGNVCKVGMLKNLEFTHAAVEFTKQATFRTFPFNEQEMAERRLKRKENTDYSLHYTAFVDWLEKDESGLYENLKLYLSSHKLTNKYTRKKLSSKAPPNKHLTENDIRDVA